MKKLAMLILLMLPLVAVAQYPGQKEEIIKVKTAVPVGALSFDLDQVRLLDGPFKKAMEIDQMWLNTADVERFMHTFRVTAGLKSDARAFGGWEALDVELRGHSVGHLLTALAEMYASTGNPLYKEKGDLFVKELAECQEALGESGYLSAFPEHLIDRAIAATSVWAPWYTLHKIYQGLLDMYLFCGNEQAYQVVLKMCDWAYDKLKPLSDETLQKMLAIEFGGMEEAFYNIYAVSGDEHHRELAEKFYHKRILDPLSQGRDCLNGTHANTQIPKIIGEARGYELTGKQSQYDVARFFWRTVIDNHTYVTGGNSDGEYFGEPGKLSDRLGESTTETCNTYNMLKLTRHLFILDPTAGYADYYERALYNHILSSQDPVHGGVTYFHTLHPGSAKDYNIPFMAHTCCVGTGYENHAKYPEAIYYRTGDDKGLYVNLFIASKLDWNEKGITLTQETKFPDEASTKLTLGLTQQQKQKFSIYLRYPHWATEGVVLKINGRKARTNAKPGSYIALERNWKDGDVIEMQMPMSLRLEFLPDNPAKGSILYGPIVLGAELGTERVDETFGVPVFINASKTDLSSWIRPVEGSPLTFETFGTGRPNEAHLSPLFRIHNQHYSVYFDFFTEADWTNKQIEYERVKREEQAIADRTVDRVGIGEHQSERDHKVEDKISYIYQQGSNMGRDVRDGGYLHYTVAVSPEIENEMMLTFWGMDGKAYSFDVFIDGQLYTTIEVKHEALGKFYNKFYPIPKSFTAGKNEVRLSFIPSKGQRAGVIYGLRILRPEHLDK